MTRLGKQLLVSGRFGRAFDRCRNEYGMTGPVVWVLFRGAVVYVLYCVVVSTLQDEKFGVEESE